MKALTVKEFNKLPRAKKAVLVAKDVLEQLKAEVYEASGCYVYLYSKTGDWDQSAKDALDKKELTCHVCARGALFLSSVRYKNQLTLKDVDECGFDYENNAEKSATEFLKSIFSLEQQRMIEAAYEDNLWYLIAGNGKDLDQIPDKKKDAILNFIEEVSRRYLKDYEKYSSIEDLRLIMICKNIIKNNGIFKP